MQRRTTIIIGILVAFIGILAFFQTPLMRQARLSTWNATVRLISRVFSIDDALSDTTINDRLNELTSENAHLRAELQDYKNIRAQLGTPTMEQLRLVNAAVIARPADALQSEFVITKGINDGVAIGDPVVIFGSTLIGFVSESQPDSSTVQTLFHPQVRVTVEVNDEDDDTPSARGLLESRFSSALFVSTIPRDIPIASDNAVTTVADDTHTPPGLLVGTLASVESKEHDAYQEARLKTTYDLDRIDVVSVLAQP